MISLFNRFLSELQSRFNPHYLRYRIFNESLEIKNYINFLSEKFNGNKNHSPNPVAADEISFSIVVPTYGISVFYLKEFVESIYQQSYKNWKLCICNDNDPDPQVINYLNNLKTNDSSRVELVLHSKNEGISAATLSALKLAEGDYTVLADADDKLHPRALEVFYYAIRNNPNVDFIYSNHDYMTDWGFRLHPMFKPAWSPELLLHVNYINHLKVIRTKFLKSIASQAFNSKYNGAQDWALCFQILKNANKVFHIPLVLYYWRARKGSMADDIFSKPWAVAAQWELRKKIVSELNPKLQLSTETKSVIFIDKAKIDSVLLSQIKNFDSIEHLGREILQKIESLEGEYIHFCLAPTSDSHLQQLAAYCALPHVGCVWPSHEQYYKQAYTISGVSENSISLAPIQRQQSSYADFTGNILAGPLASLTMNKTFLRKNLILILEKGIPSNFTGNVMDVLGILLSMSSLSQGYRNLSVSNVKIEYKPGSVTLPKSYVTAFDPYL